MTPLVRRDLMAPSDSPPGGTSNRAMPRSPSIRSRAKGQAAVQTTLAEYVTRLSGQHLHLPTLALTSPPHHHAPRAHKSQERTFFSCSFSHKLLPSYGSPSSFSGGFSPRRSYAAFQSASRCAFAASMEVSVTNRDATEVGGGGRAGESSGLRGSGGQLMRS